MYTGRERCIRKHPCLVIIRDREDVHVHGASLLLFLVELYYIHQAYPATVSIKHQLFPQKPYVRLGTPGNQKSIK